jgi:hypothetical protein
VVAVFFDRVGNLYGTTEFGGVQNQNGTELFLDYRQVAGCGAKPFSIASVTAKIARNRQSNS